MTTVLALVQSFTDKLGLPTPSAMVGSQDKAVKQMKALLQETVRDLGEYRWQNQRVRTTFISVAGTDQGALTTLFGAGYSGLVPDSLWNVTRHSRVFGPLSDQVWNALQTLPNAGPEFQSWISQGHLFISPALAAGNTLSGVYITKYTILDQNGVTYKELIAADTDSLVFPDNVVLRGFEYKWRKQKGESGWQDDYNDFMGLVAKNMVKDGATRLNLSLDCGYDMRPGITIPPGSWNV